MGRFVQLMSRDARPFQAYLAVPVGSLPAPGLIVLPEVYNLNMHIREVCDEYASQGFCVLAPDVYWRQEPGSFLHYDPEGLAKARALRGQLDTQQFSDDLEDMIQHLAGLPECTGKIGVLGYCLGGKFAYLSAARHRIQAAVSYYGVEIEKHLDEAGAVACPLLMHFAENDKSVPTDTVDLIKSRMDGLPGVEIHVYPGTQHAFNRRGYPPYHPEQARIALDRTIRHLKTHLGQGTPAVSG
jgi:carboxymethylenebutenolidase